MNNTVANTNVSLAPRVLRAAGVPFKDALWLTLQGAAKAHQGVILNSERGRWITACVSRYMQTRNPTHGAVLQ
jgi:hypothetical protein